jgi:lauroyl/myristoyl acyltransferase
VTDVTPDQAQEFATLFFRNQTESYIAENRLCAMSKKPFAEYASRSILKSLSKEGEDLLLNANGPIVLAAFHFSTFFHLCTGLAELMKGKKKIHVLAYKTERGALENLLVTKHVRFYGSRYWGLDQEGALRNCLREVKSQDSILICYCDLDSTYGMWSDCHFMGKPARMNTGAIRVARMLKAPLVTGFASGNVIRDGSFSINITDAQTDLTQSKAVLKRLIKSLENAVLTQPEDWRHWPQIERYFQCRGA